MGSGGEFINYSEARGMMKGFRESQAGREVALGILLGKEERPGKGKGGLGCWNREGHKVFL